MLMIARTQRLAARAAKRVREIDLSGVPKFCRTLPRRFALKRYEDERLQTVHKSNCRGVSRPQPNHDLHTIDATLARWRGDVGLSPLDSVSTAAFAERKAT